MSIKALLWIVQNSDRKFNELMKYLMTANAGGQASSSITQIGAADSGNQEAGDDSTSISGKVQ